MHRILIEPQCDGQRLDMLIAAYISISRNKAQNLILRGQVVLEGKVMQKNNHITRVGDIYVVSVALDRLEGERLLPNPNIRLGIVHEDRDIIVIEKDPGVVVHPGNGVTDGTVANALLAHCGSCLNVVGSSARPGIVHRLDKDTSGLMVAAKTESAYYKLSEALAIRNFRKEYLAMTWGIPNPIHGLIQTNIGARRSDVTMMEVTRCGGKPAVTEYRVERAFGTTACLVRCILHTGRTHQIRVHMSHIGHSIVGDQKYGKNSRKCLRHGVQEMSHPKRQMLHACTLGFYHPSTEEYVEFRSEPSSDIQQLIAALEDRIAIH
ncbi:MAG: RluA family pseudouridine synthase [Anaplasma sp.]